MSSKPLQNHLETRHQSAEGFIEGAIAEATVIGQGKVEEVTLEAQRSRANLVVFNRDISATQAGNLEEQIGLLIVDRTEEVSARMHPNPSY